MRADTFIETGNELAGTRPSLRASGLAMIAGGLLWQPMLAFEKLADLNRASSNWQWYLDQAGFLVAMALLLMGLYGLDQARIAGEGRMRWAMHGLVLAWALLVGGQVLNLLGLHDNVLVPVGGLGSYPAAIIAGIGVVLVDRLPGWRRWTLLVQGLYMTFIVFLPLVIFNLDGPSWVVEAVWQLMWALVGVAALTTQGSRQAA